MLLKHGLFLLSYWCNFYIFKFRGRVAVLKVKAIQASLWRHFFNRQSLLSIQLLIW